MSDLSPLFGDPADAFRETIVFRVFPKSGPARWLLEDRFNSPWHLKTWPRANFRARLIFHAAWLLSRIGVHLPSRLERIPVARTSVYAKLRADYDRIGVFLGTPGPNRKFVVYASRKDRSIFVKIPTSPASEALVRNESDALEALSAVPSLAALIPDRFIVAGQLAVGDVETDGAHYGMLAPLEVVRFCSLLEAHSFFTRPLHALRLDWEVAAVGPLAKHEREVSVLIESARNSARRYLDNLPSDLLLSCYYAHGDFTPWNVLRAADGSARVIDWEMFGPKPVGFDLVHYYVSYDLLVKKRGAVDVLRNLANVGKNSGEPPHWRLSQGLYFSIQALYYSGIYERQKFLHPQALTQLRAWAEVLEVLFDGQLEVISKKHNRSD